MAARNSKNSDAQRQAKILAWLSEFDGGVSVQEVAEEFGIAELTANNDLVALNHADKIDIVEGMWVLSGEAETPVPTPEPVTEAPEQSKRHRRTKAEMEAAREEERKRTEYAARAAESQDAVMSQAPEHTGKHAKPAVEPVKAADGTNVTVPVSEGSTERRELDASKGERLISEDFIPSFEESKITEEFVPPTMIPAVPAGVNENTWVMAYYANTASARAWWMAKAKAQMVPAA